MQINYLFTLLLYIFSNDKTCHLFKKAATSAEIKGIIDCKEEYFIARLTADSEQVSLEKLEDPQDISRGDELMDMDSDLAEQEQQDLSEITHTAGINIQL